MIIGRNTHCPSAWTEGTSGAIAARTSPSARNALFNEDAAAPALWAIEAGQQQVQVQRQRVHRHHFIGLRADEAGQARAQRFGIVDPGAATGMMAGDAQAFPVVEFFLYQLPGGARCKPQGLAAEVEQRAALRAGRQCKSIPQWRQLIGGIQRARLFVG
jgi:hypothetical protein